MGHVTSRPGKLARWCGLAAGLLVLVLAGAALVGRHELMGSLARLDGRVAVPGISAVVTVERDARGIPTIRGRSRSDVAFATGFVHAQDRFFQMDLLRRRAAGELAELFGPAAVSADREVRMHRLRHVAEEAFLRCGAADREVLVAYADGVTAGLADLGGPPPEYLVLRASPRPWRPEDSFLVSLAMYLTLQDADGERERALGLMSATLPAPLVAFLTPAGTEWDAPLIGGPEPGPPPPGPEVTDLRARPPAPQTGALGTAESEIAGSNSWAVAGSRTATGAALVANDPHLPLGVPNTWYRAVLEWTSPDGARRRVAGVTIPGVPVVVIGSNGTVAWGFTNSQGDWSDVIVLEPGRDDPESYRVAGGNRRLEHFSETIAVKGGGAITLDVPWTIWGPVIGHDAAGHPTAVRWVGHDADAIGSLSLGFETAASLPALIDAAHRSGLPAQNLVCGSADGHIAWTIAGRMPRRVGCDGRVPVSWADGACGWDGYRAPSEIPVVIDPPGGLIWTANARVLAGSAQAMIGDGGLSLGARAGQIRDDLGNLARAGENDMLAVQLDDEARFLTRWRTHLLALLTPEACAGHPARERFRDLVERTWTGHAAIDSVAYRLVRGYRAALATRVLDFLTAPCRARDAQFSPYAATSQWEGPLWTLVTARPANLLDARFSSWRALELDTVDALIAELTAGGRALEARSWGERNTAVIRHPLSAALPRLARWLDMPAEPLPGDRDMPRVQAPSFGASMRMAVSPGHEDAALLHMPGGQSGHPLSRFYSLGHERWAHGEAEAMLPGPVTHTLTLVPASPMPTP